MLPKKYMDPVGREVIQWVRTKLTGSWLELDYDSLSITEQKSLSVLRESGMVQCQVQIEASRDDGKRYSAKGTLTGVMQTEFINWYLLRAVPSWFENNREKMPIKKWWGVLGARLSLFGLRVKESFPDNEDQILFASDQRIPGTLELNDDRVWYDHSINIETHAHAEVNAAFQNNNNFSPVNEIKIENTFPPELIEFLKAATKPDQQKETTTEKKEAKPEANSKIRSEHLTALIRSTLAGMHKLTGNPTEYIDEPFKAEEIAREAEIYPPDGKPTTWRNKITNALAEIFDCETKEAHSTYNRLCKNRKRFKDAINSDHGRFRNTASMTDESMVEDETDWRITPE